MNGKSITDTFSSLRGRLKAAASSILRNEDDVEDALQDAFCRLWTRRADITEERIEANAHIAVKQVSLDLLRKRTLRATEEIDDGKTGDPMEETSLWETKEIDELRVRLLERLSERQRMVFEMVADGMENRVIALRLGMTEEAVRQNLSRARKALREHYNKIR